MYNTVEEGIKMVVANKTDLVRQRLRVPALGAARPPNLAA